MTSEETHLVTRVTETVLLILSAAVALTLLLELPSIIIMGYLAATAGRVPQTFELVGTAGLMAILGLILAFLLILRKIVSNAAKAPFTPENARRLNCLGWIALAWQALIVFLAMGGQQINIINTPGLLISIVDARSYSASGLILVLALFVLAGIFHRGAQMREDLEGTV